MNELEKTFKVSRIVYLALSLTVPVFIGVVELLNHLGLKGVIPDFETKAGFLRYVFYILGISMLFAVRFVKAGLLAKRFACEYEALKTLSVSSILAGALNEASALMGFMLFIFSGNKADFYILASLSLFSVGLNFPKKEKWEELVRTNTWGTAK